MAGADWRTALIRASLFPQQAIPLTVDVLSAFAGEAPVRQEDRPKEGIRQQSGEVDGAQLTITATPIVLQIILSPAQVSVQHILAEEPPLAGELKAELAKFERRLLAWLPKWEFPTTRVGLGVQGRASAGSKVAAYQILKANLRSVNVDPEGMSDLIFRVNWKAPTRVIPEGYYNRLSTWSAVQVRASAMSGPTSPEVLIGERDFAQVDLDINTPAERADPLPRERFETIYREFFQLAVGLAESGEGR